MPAAEPLDKAPIPSTDVIRLRLAHVATEAALLRAQLRVSRRYETERERLRRLQATEGRAGA